MNISIVLAQMLGIFFIVLGLSLMFNKKRTIVVIDEMIENQSIIWLAGLVTLILGSTIVAFNNIWTAGLPLLVTIIGWLTLVKGAFILIFPDFITSYYRKMNKGNIFFWGGVVVFLLGIILFYW